MAVACGATYFGVAELAMRFPAQPDEPARDGPVAVFFASNGVHVDVFVPVVNEVHDWSAALASDVRIPAYGYLGLGWGDRDFYLNVPTWDDLTIPMALRGAFLPTESAMRVRWISGPPQLSENIHRVQVDHASYGRLVEYLDRGFARDGAGEVTLLTTTRDDKRREAHFFAGSDKYHLFRTCNSWTNGAVRAAGLTAPRWAPLERHVRHNLPPSREPAGVRDE